MAMATDLESPPTLLPAPTRGHAAKVILFAVALMLGLVASADAQLGFGIGIRQAGISIGLNFATYPYLVPVPGYPVYYAPEADSNYFFYDGLYWVFLDDNWYASSWYNGPWDLIDPYYVPAYLLRIPVRYYRRPPPYFRGWGANAPPRWNEHWGRDWDERRRGWNRWDSRSVPPPAPLPGYQRQYSGNRYPRSPEQQRSIQAERYRYRPSDPVARQFWQQPPPQRPGRQQPRQPWQQQRQQQQQQQWQQQPPPRRDQHQAPMQPPPVRQPQQWQGPRGQHPVPAQQAPRQGPQQGPARQGAAPQDRGPRRDTAPRGRGGEGQDGEHDRGPH